MRGVVENTQPIWYLFKGVTITPEKGHKFRSNRIAWITPDVGKWSTQTVARDRVKPSGPGAVKIPTSTNHDSWLAWGYSEWSCRKQTPLMSRQASRWGEFLLPRNIGTSCLIFEVVYIRAAIVNKVSTFVNIPYKSTMWLHFSTIIFKVVLLSTDVEILEPVFRNFQTTIRQSR